MKALVVIDMQNDFITGTLGTNEAISIVPNVAKKIKECQQKNGKIVFTRDTHTENYLKTQEGKNLPVLHCVKGTNGWEITKELEVSDAKIFDKATFGSFELADYLAKLKDVDEIELVGLCTDICVISNALILKAKMPEIKIYVDAKCCAGVNPQTHLTALAAMKMCQIEIKNL